MIVDGYIDEKSCKLQINEASQEIWNLNILNVCRCVDYDDDIYLAYNFASGSSTWYAFLYEPGKDFHDETYCKYVNERLMNAKDIYLSVPGPSTSESNAYHMSAAQFMDQMSNDDGIPDFSLEEDGVEKTLQVLSQFATSTSILPTAIRPQTDPNYRMLWDLMKYVSDQVCSTVIPSFPLTPDLSDLVQETLHASFNSKQESRADECSARFFPSIVQADTKVSDVMKDTCLFFKPHSLRAWLLHGLTKKFRNFRLCFHPGVESTIDSITEDALGWYATYNKVYQNSLPPGNPLKMCFDRKLHRSLDNKSSGKKVILNFIWLPEQYNENENVFDQLVCFDAALVLPVGTITFA